MKGKNGQQVAQENIQKVETWIHERNQHRDWHEYEFNNRIKRRALAQELDFAYSVCTQNKAVRKLLEDAEELWFAPRVIEKDAHEAARERAEKRSGKLSSDNSELVQRNAELEAENRRLQRELNAYKEMESLVANGMPGFKP